MQPAVRDAITQAAQEAGIEPSFALAVAERESSGRPTAKNSKTIYGLYQMRGDHRQRYGGADADSTDPLTQARMWTRFIGDVKGEMAQHLGRDPTDAEAYLGHHFGGARAARMVNGSVDPSTDVRDVFTPTEMAANRHFAAAGTSGNLVSSITDDMNRRQAKYGGSGSPHTDAIDYAAFGEPEGGVSRETSGPIDFASFGEPETKGAIISSPSNEGGKIDMASNGKLSARPGAEVDLSQFGLTSGPQPIA